MFSPYVFYTSYNSESIERRTCIMDDEKLISKLKEDVKLARSLAFNDFVDGVGDGTKRSEAAKVAETISKIELEVQKQADDLRLREEEQEFNFKMKEEQLKIEQERLEMDRKRLEFEEQKRKEDSEAADRRKKLDYLEAGLKTCEFGVGVWSAKAAFEHLRNVTLAEEQPRLIPRIPYDVAKRNFENACRGLRHMRF